MLNSKYFLLLDILVTQLLHYIKRPKVSITLKQLRLGKLRLSIIFTPNLVITKESLAVQECIFSFHFGMQTKPDKVL